MTETTTTLIFYSRAEGEALYPLNLPLSTKAIVRRLNRARTEAKSGICQPRDFGIDLHSIYLPDGRAWDVKHGFRKYGDPEYYKRVYDLLSQAHLQEAYERLRKE